MRTRATKQPKLWNFRPPIPSPAYLVHQVPGSKVSVAHQPARHHCRAREANMCTLRSAFWWLPNPPAYQGQQGSCKAAYRAIPATHTGQCACTSAAAKLVAAAAQVGEAAALQAAQAAPVGHLHERPLQHVRPQPSCYAQSCPAALALVLTVEPPCHADALPEQCRASRPLDC